jgi:hypothetical protein
MRVARGLELILRVELLPELRMNRLSNTAQQYGGRQAFPQVERFCVTLLCWCVSKGVGGVGELRDVIADFGIRDHR